MAQNTLTNLIGPLYKALDVVSREMVGAIPCATLDADVSRAAVGQVLYSFKSPKATATDVTPGVTPPDDGEQAFGNIDMSITKTRRVPFRWNGEQQLGLSNSGNSPRAMMNDQMTQAIRTLVNEIEMDTVRAARIAASRAFGTPGTNPFATDLAAAPQLRKIMDDNGSPLGDRCLVIDTTAGAQLRTLVQLNKANEAGTNLTLRQGELLDLSGFSIHESAGVVANAKGTGTLYTSDATGYAVDSTLITVITGSGTVLAGDVVTFAGDTNKYVVAKDLTGPGVLQLNSPGLRIALPAGATAMTVGAAATGSIAFAKSSLLLATRAPALPDGGDMAVDRMTVTDPRSGISFEVAMYAQYRQMQYEVSVAWGVKGIKSDHSALLLG